MTMEIQTVFEFTFFVKFASSWFAKEFLGNSILGIKSLFSLQRIGYPTKQIQMKYLIYQKNNAK